MRGGPRSLLERGTKGEEKGKIIFCSERKTFRRDGLAVDTSDRPILFPVLEISDAGGKQLAGS